MFIKDRGNIKWTSLMLVEHKKRLRKLKEEEGDRQMPELDPQKLKKMDYILQKAQKENLQVKITYHQQKKFKVITGFIQGVYPAKKKIIIMYQNKDKTLYVDKIVEIKIV